MDDWRELHRCPTLDEANRLATSVAAMEFSVRVRAAADEPGTAGSMDADGDAVAGPFVVEVTADDRADLAPLVAEILAEQDDFDALLDARRQAASRLRHRAGLLIVIVAIVTILVALLSGR